MAGGSLAIPIILFCFLSLLLIIFCYELKKKYKIPINPCLILVGVLLRLIVKYVIKMDSMIYMIDHIKAEVIELVMLPCIIFHAAFFLDWFKFKKQLIHTMPMATTVLCITSLLTGVTFKHIFNYKYSFEEAFLLGVLMSATDHVSIKTLVKDVHMSEKLEGILKGETILNVATVLVLFKLLTKILFEDLESEKIFAFFLRLSIVGFLFGITFAITMGIILKRYVNDYIQETNITVVVTYLVYWICSYKKVEASGGVAMVVLGLYMSCYGKTFISPSVAKNLHTTWNIFVTNVECLIFIIAGIILGKYFTDSNYSQATDFGLSIVLFILLHIFRYIALLVHYPLFKYLKNPLSLKEILCLSSAGIKGGISCALAIMIYSLENASDSESNYGSTILFFAIFISSISVLVDAFLTNFVVKKFKLGHISDVEENILLGVTTAILEEITLKIDQLRSDKDFNLVTWDEVKDLAGPKMLLEEVMKTSEIGKSILAKYSNESTERLLQIYNSHFKIDENLYSKEMRRRFYSTLKGVFWDSYEKGECYASTVLHLVNCCNKSLDADHEHIRIWDNFQEYIYNEKHLKFYKRFTNTPLVGFIFRRIAYDKIVKAYDIALTFTRANGRTEEIMDTMEKDLENEAFESIMEEAHTQVLSCQDFIKEYITDSYPDIIAEVQTKMACFLLLNKQTKIVEHIYEQGVIKELEFDHLFSSIASNLKQLTFMSKPEIPTLLSMLKKRFKKTSVYEIKKILPHIEERRFKPQSTLFTEGQPVEGAYLLFSGTVHEAGPLIDHVLTKDNIVGAFHLIQGFQDVYMTTAITSTVVIASFIPINILNNFFVEDVYKESAKQFVLFHKEKFGLKDTQNTHINKVIDSSSVLHLYSGSPLNLRRGAFVLKGRVRKEKEAFSLLRPSKKIIESLEEAIVLIFPPHFGSILKQHLLIGDAFASYFIKGPAKKNPSQDSYAKITAVSTFKINQLETTANFDD